VAVHVGHLQLVLEVRDGPQTAQHDPRLLATAVIDQEAFEGVHLDALRIGADLLQRLADHGDALVHAEERMLALVVEYGDDDGVEGDQVAHQDAGVAVGDGIERTGIDGSAHGTAFRRRQGLTPLGAPR